jgi:HEAT repeat protein
MLNPDAPRADVQHLLDRALGPASESTDPQQRADIVRGLTAASAAVVNVLGEGLGNPDERVRAACEAGLRTISEQHALAACLSTLDNETDEVQADMTPAVLAPSQMGWMAAPYLLDRMLVDKPTTRLRAQRALELIVVRAHGSSSVSGFLPR